MACLTPHGAATATEVLREGLLRLFGLDGAAIRFARFDNYWQKHASFILQQMPTLIAANGRMVMVLSVSLLIRCVSATQGGIEALRLHTI
jgi:hypothetical protein